LTGELVSTEHPVRVAAVPAALAVAEVVFDEDDIQGCSTTTTLLP
jgi:hypothetical protein